MPGTEFSRNNHVDERPKCLDDFINDLLPDGDLGGSYVRHRDVAKAALAAAQATWPEFAAWRDSVALAFAEQAVIHVVAQRKQGARSSL